MYAHNKIRFVACSFVYPLINLTGRIIFSGHNHFDVFKLPELICQLYGKPKIYVLFVNILAIPYCLGSAITTTVKAAETLLPS